jgi:hypothetical protein
MKRQINKIFVTILFLVLGGFFSKAICQQNFDKAGFYKVMAHADLAGVDNQLKQIESATDINKEAYKGTLLMKRAGLIKGASKKLSVFKDGNKLLEAVIKKDNQNPEWHFLRLLIQENAPRILGYNDDIKSDASFIQSNFKKLSPEVQSAVLDYQKQSNALKPLNF